MRRRLPLLLLAGLLFVPVTARADWGVRAELPRADVRQHRPAPRPSNPTSRLDVRVRRRDECGCPTSDLVLSWYPLSFISLDLEGQFNLSSTNIDYPNTGIYVGPGVTLDLPLFLYARVSLPVQVTPSSAIWYLRAAGGFKLEFFVVRLYLEALFDFPLAGGATSAFGSQAISLAAGVWVKF